MMVLWYKQNQIYVEKDALKKRLELSEYWNN